MNTVTPMSPGKSAFVWGGAFAVVGYFLGAVLAILLTVPVALVLPATAGPAIVGGVIGLVYGYKRAKKK